MLDGSAFGAIGGIIISDHVGHARSPYSSLVGDISGVESVVIYCILLFFGGQSPVGLRFLWWPEPGGPKVLVRGPAVPSGGEWIPHGTI